MTSSLWHRMNIENGTMYRGTGQGCIVEVVGCRMSHRMEIGSRRAVGASVRHVSRVLCVTIALEHTCDPDDPITLHHLWRSLSTLLEVCVCVCACVTVCVCCVSCEVCVSVDCACSVVTD